MDEHLGPPTLDYSPPTPPPSRLPLIALVCGIASGPAACGLAIAIALANDRIELPASSVICLLGFMAPLVGTNILGVTAYRVEPVTPRNRAFALVAVFAPAIWLIGGGFLVLGAILGN